MNKVERSRAEMLGNIPWLIFLAWWGWTNLRSENVDLGTNPVKILMLGIVIVFVGYAIAQIIWLFSNPFALIEKGNLIICPSPFQKETIKIETLVKIRETLSREKQKIFGFNAYHNVWILVFDYSNGVTVNVPLSGYSKKREELTKLLTENNINIEKQ